MKINSYSRYQTCHPSVIVAAQSIRRMLIFRSDWINETNWSVDSSRVAIHIHQLNHQYVSVTRRGDERGESQRGRWWREPATLPREALFSRPDERNRTEPSPEGKQSQSATTGKLHPCDGQIERLIIDWWQRNLSAVCPLSDCFHCSLLSLCKWPEAKGRREQSHPYPSAAAGKPRRRVPLVDALKNHLNNWKILSPLRIHWILWRHKFHK